RKLTKRTKSWAIRRIVGNMTSLVRGGAKGSNLHRAGTVRLDVVRAARRHSSSGSTAPASAISLNNFSVAADALMILEASAARKPSRPGEPHLLAAAGISKAISWLRLKRGCGVRGVLFPSNAHTH